MTDKTSQNSQEQEPTKFLPFFIRLFWMFVGNVVLVFLAFSISMRNESIIVDAAFWLTVIVLVSIRYVDIKWFKGQTGDAEPATLKDWRQYSIRLVLASVGLYALVRLVAHFKLL
ncbi:MAG: hypothetical protein QG657_1669 [Acidobacteriota bacterium]|nr:hypothetical protein [Acidobacteriota bacterium]